MIEKSVLEISGILNDDSIIPVILDVREKWEYDICHIENSVHIPMGQITERKDDLNNNDMTRLMYRIFDKKIGSTMLRHIFLTDKYKNVMSDMKEDTEAMGTSVDVAENHYIKKD